MDMENAVRAEISKRTQSLIAGISSIENGSLQDGTKKTAMYNASVVIGSMKVTGLDTLSTWLILSDENGLTTYEHYQEKHRSSPTQRVSYLFHTIRQKLRSLKSNNDLVN